MTLRDDIANMRAKRAHILDMVSMEDPSVLDVTDRAALIVMIMVGCALAGSGFLIGYWMGHYGRT